MNTPPNRWGPPSGPPYQYRRPDSPAATIWFVVALLLGLAAVAAYLLATDAGAQAVNYAPSIILAGAAAVALIVGAIFAASGRD